ncbi:hypothetical protein KR026_002241 [Drosophila bipectinata]|nr:hypothetical protein KR026_002241 [Drosophila bipectinata]
MGSNKSSGMRPDAVRDGDAWERDINNNLMGRRISRAPQSLDDLSDALPGSNASSERRPVSVRDGDVWERDINNNLTGRRIPRAVQELRWSLDKLSDELTNPLFKRPTICECCTRWTHFICGICHTSFRKTPTENGGGGGLPKKRLSDCIPLEYPECPYCHSFSTMVDVDYKD